MDLDLYKRFERIISAHVSIHICRSKDLQTTYKYRSACNYYYYCCRFWYVIFIVGLVAALKSRVIIWSVQYDGNWYVRERQIGAMEKDYYYPLGIASMKFVSLFSAYTMKKYCHRNQLKHINPKWCHVNACNTYVPYERMNVMAILLSKKFMDERWMHSVTTKKMMPDSFLSFLGVWGQVFSSHFRVAWNGGKIMGSVNRIFFCGIQCSCFINIRI